MADRRALIVGGGIGGMSAAVALRRAKLEVELVDIDPEWKVYGAGITLTGPTLRALQALGVFERVAEEAYAGDGIDICDVEGRVQALVETPVAAGSTTPGSGGILRPTLHRILSESVLGSGATVRLGVTVDTITQIGERVEVRFSDGREDVLDLVVGADGLGSKVRRLLFPGAPGPVYTGQVCWRVNAPRAPEIVRRRYFLGGPQKAGLSPVAQDQMYLFLLQTQPIKQRATGDLHGQLRAMLAPFGGALADLRESLSEETVIVPRPLETFVLPAPWFAGSVVLIGDAAHPTTPHLASGAGLAIEDGLVLAEEMGMGGRTPDALARFTERRYARCSLVVQNSAEIGRRELANAPPAEQTELITETLRALGRPY